MTKSKTQRLSMIRSLVTSNTVKSQEELSNLLKKKGFEVTQATLSRDIKELKIIKLPDSNGNYIYTFHARNIYAEKLEENASTNDSSTGGFISLEFSGQLGVIRTRPGYAGAVAFDIDNKAGHVIVGTIAGDDTILLIPREGFTRNEVINVLSTFLPELKN